MHNKVNLTRHFSSPSLKVLAVALASMGAFSSANAFTLDFDNPDLKFRWDNTFKYNAGYRLNNPSAQVAGDPAVNPNFDGGDLNFNRGLINNRFDLLSEVDISYKGFGARVSGAGWYDSVYRKDSTDFPAGRPPNSIAALSGPNNRFSSATRKEMGADGEINDAFVYGNFDIADKSLTVRVGRHTQLYGETLYLGGNGIANAQGPVDLVKAYSQPTAQFKEIARPVGQVSSVLQLNPDVSIGAYYQYEWRPMRLPAAGSYFSPADVLGAGGDLLWTPFGPSFRGADEKGADSGQFGGNVKFRIGAVEYGVYAAQYHDKAPIVVWNGWQAGTPGPGFPLPTTYQLYYQKNVKTFGASFSTVVGETNIAGEMSTRRGTPLTVPGDLFLNLDPNANNDGNAPYALGNSLHANLSAISLFSGTPLWGAATLTAELGYNRLLSVTHNAAALNPDHTRDHWATRIVFQPEYYQVLPQLDLQVPISVGYGIAGKSAVLQMEPEHGGEVSVGFNFDYQKIWKAGLQVTHYFGHEGTVGTAGLPGSYKQYYGDRDFAMFSLQRTF
jgi:hypothetical protein